MVDRQQKPMNPVRFLEGHAHADSGNEMFDLHELTGIELVHVSFPRGHLPRLDEHLEKTIGLSWPDPGRFSATGTASADPGGAPLLLMWLAPDQCMLLAPQQDSRLARFIDSLDGIGYATDQTDNWVALRLSGDLAVPGLERICPLDLHLTAMPTGTAARTVMEHLAVIILRESADGFLLLSPSSSARSFHHAVETSMTNAGA